MWARLDTFLDAYSAVGVPVHFSSSAVTASTIERLRVLATWTTEHARMNGVAALANHGEMYLAHARWPRHPIARGQLGARSQDAGVMCLRHVPIKPLHVTVRGS